MIASLQTHATTYRKDRTSLSTLYDELNRHIDHWKNCNNNPIVKRMLESQLPGFHQQRTMFKKDMEENTANCPIMVLGMVFHGLNPFTPTDHVSVIQHNEWKSSLCLLSIERVKYDDESVQYYDSSILEN